MLTIKEIRNASAELPDDGEIFIELEDGTIITATGARVKHNGEGLLISAAASHTKLRTRQGDYREHEAKL